ncbi:uncharacterized protein LOC143302350 [Babylonia areolata]|uniref:uncharacterized protein LOC143302350 n=1 Tax=Babylonia areolata TaxID=304850 RepID=UPI003FD45CD5
METGSRKRKLSSDITENPQKLQQTPSHRDPQTQITMETGSRKRKLSSDITENRQKLQQAFWSMPSDHPIWICLLPYLSTEDKLVLRDVNRNCQDIMDSAFSKALTITVPSDTPSEMIKIVMENNRCVRNLTAQHCKTVQDIVAWFPYQVRLVRVDLSHSVFTSVEYAVDTLVDCCRQLEKVCLQNLTENEYPLAVRSKQWPFHGLLRNPLPRLQHLDISGNGSRWLSPSMFASLIEKHPRLHTLSVDCGVLMSWLRRVQRIQDLMDLRHFFTTEEDYRRFITFFQNGNGQLISCQQDLDTVMEAWLASPALINLTLSIGLNALSDVEWFLSLISRSQPWSQWMLNNSPRRENGLGMSPEPQTVLICVRNEKGEDEDGTPQPLPEVSVTRCWMKIHNLSLSAFSNRVKLTEIPCNCHSTPRPAD